MRISFIGWPTRFGQMAMESLAARGHSVHFAKYGQNVLASRDIGELADELGGIAARSDILVCTCLPLAELAGLAAKKHGCASLGYSRSDFVYRASELAKKLFDWHGSDAEEFLAKIEECTAREDRAKLRVAIVAGESRPFPAMLDYLAFVRDFLLEEGIACDLFQERELLEIDWDSRDICVLALGGSELSKACLRKIGKPFTVFDICDDDRRTLLDLLRDFHRNRAEVKPGPDAASDAPEGDAGKPFSGSNAADISDEGEKAEEPADASDDPFSVLDAVAEDEESGKDAQPNPLASRFGKAKIRIVPEDWD